MLTGLGWHRGEAGEVCKDEHLEELEDANLEIIIYTLISGFSRENRKLSGKFTFPRGFETLFGPISSRA